MPDHWPKENGIPIEAEPPISSNNGQVMVHDLNSLQELSEIHFDVLNLLEKRLTSKQIALELEISPATVEQRIRKARAAFGNVSRQEAIDQWVLVKNSVTKTLYEPAELSTPQTSRVEGVNEAEPVLNGDVDPGDTTQVAGAAQPEPIGFVSKVFGSRRSPMVTIGVIVALSFVIMVILLVGLLVAGQVNDLVG